MLTRPTLIIFIKPPRMGLSKTRLARGLGRTEARRIAGGLLAHTLRVARQSSCTPVLAISPDQATHVPIWPLHFARAPQGPGTLTHRLTKSLRAAPPGPVFFIGADAPALSPSLLRTACRTLARHDAVFGPARDGGFWLFGLHKTACTRAPFEGVRWSSEYTMRDVAACLSPTARVAYLPTLIDIDEAQDWQDWRREMG